MSFLNCNYTYKGKQYDEKSYREMKANEYFKEKGWSGKEMGTPITNISTFSDLDTVFSGHTLTDGAMLGKNIEDKVNMVYDRMLANEAEVILSSGEKAKRPQIVSVGHFSVNYSEIPKESWKDMIREKIIEKQDLQGEKTKDILISFLNKDAVSHYDNDRFNKLFDEAERVFTQTDVDRIMKTFNWSNGKRYMRLSDAINEGIITNITPGILGDYNPLIGVSTITQDGQQLHEVDVFNVTRRSLFSIAEDAQQGNIMGTLVGDNMAKKHGVHLSNSYFSRQTILMNLTTNIIARNNKNITIKDAVVVQITPYGDKAQNRIVSGTVDHIIAKEQQRNMMKFAIMEDVLPQEIQSHFINDNESNNSENYIKFLLNFYDNEGGVGENFERQRSYFVNDIKHFMNFGSDAFNKSRLINLINSRLSYLHRMAVVNGETYLTTPEAMAEHRYLLDALSSLKNLDTFSYQLNDMKDISKMQSYISLSSAIPQEDFQTIQKVISDTSMSVVREMQEFNKQFNKKVFDVYLKNHEMNLGALRNENYFMYEKSMAKVVDMNGIERNSGFLLWTTDENLDPLFAKQTKEKLANRTITQEILDANKWMVEQITNRYIDSIMHRYKTGHGSFYDKKLGRELKREDFEKKLLTESSYRKGMLPIIPKKKGEHFYKGEMGKSLARQMNTITKEDDYSELLDVKNDDTDTLLIDDMSDSFYDQIAYNSTSVNNMTPLGSNHFLRKIGLQMINVNGKDKITTLDSDGTANNSFSMDLQTSIKSFKLVGIRKEFYEREALPLLNGTYFKAKIANEYKGMDNKNLLELMQNYVLSAVKNETLHLKGNQFAEKALLSINKLATARIMLANLSIGQVSALANLHGAIMEALASDISGHYKFGFSELAKGSVEFFQNYGKVSELARRFQIVNASEMEQLTHFFSGYKGNKQILSEFMKSLPNWATDMYARSVVMVAQMMKDGTYDSYVFDNETGGVTYDEKSNSSRWTGEEGLARRDFVKQQQIVDGIGYNESTNTLRDAYTLQEMKNLKWISDKYLIGGYDSISSDIAGITVMGKLLKTFRTYMFAKAGVIWKESSFQNMGGRLVMIKDHDGRYVGKWERAQIEGFVNTWIRFVGGTLNIAVKNPIKYNSMTMDEKQNIARGGIAVSMFTIMALLASLLIDDDDDNPYDLIDKKTGKKRYLPGIRFYKNFEFSASALLLVEDVYGFGKNPFIGFNIINNFIYNFTGEIDTEKMKKGANLLSGLDVAYELMEVIMRGSEAMAKEHAQEMKEKRAETREENKEKRERIKELESNQ
jgi:hypothetical protein